MCHRTAISCLCSTILFLVGPVWSAPKGNPGGEVPPDIDALSDRVEVLESDVAALNTDLGTVQTNLGAVQNNLGLVQLDLGSTQVNLATLQNTVGTLDGKLSEFDAFLEAAIPEWKIVFVTGNTYTGNLGGLEGADAKCQAAADNAGLDGIFLAWLSTWPGPVIGTPSIDPRTRFIRHNVPYVRTDGVKIADHYADLVDGTIDAPIDRTESGTQLFSFDEPTLFWSTTAANGEGIVSGTLDDEDATCFNWTTDAMFTTALYLGSTTATGFSWSAPAMSTFELCGVPRHLLCVQQ